MVYLDDWLRRFPRLRDYDRRPSEQEIHNRSVIPGLVFLLIFFVAFATFTYIVVAGLS